MEKPTGTFRCLAGHILDGSELLWGIQKAWICPIKTCLHEVRKYSDTPRKELSPIDFEMALAGTRLTY